MSDGITIDSGHVKVNLDYLLESMSDDWLDKNGIESEYTTEQADEEIKQVLDIVKNAMDKLSEGIE